MQKEYYNAHMEYMNEIRSIRHDIQAHMIVLQYYLESEDYEKAKSYLQEMRQHQILNAVTIQDTGHDLVNAIVSDTLARSKRKIDFELEGILPANFCMTEYDICTLFSNIFSNAREACEKLVEYTPIIRMKVVNENALCHITVQNPIEWKIDVNELGISTTKKDKDSHGFGLKNMIKVVKQYNGKIEFLVTDTSFCVEIFLDNNRKIQLK